MLNKKQCRFLEKYQPISKQIFSVLFALNEIIGRGKAIQLLQLQHTHV